MSSYDIGVYGLGVMGSSIAKNFINKGFSTALYSKPESERSKFNHTGNYVVCDSEKSFVESLCSPKIIFLMVTAGKAVDSVIDSILPYLKEGDVIIDGGNSYFKDTSRRYSYLESKNINFMGIGVSGGEKGALEGPSMMVGGSLEGWQKAKNILIKIAASKNGEPCCNYVGKEGAGHYVKMVHNGIEYAILQLIADTYYIMDKGMDIEFNEIIDTFESFKDGQLNSYLIDITVDVLKKKDGDGAPLVTKILDVAKQKGTGSWTLQEAIDKGVYIPTICEAVFERYFSANQKLRNEGSKILKCNSKPINIDNYKEALKNSLLLGIICSFAQGLELIKKASDYYNWSIDMAAAAALWQDGCIIRSELLKDIIKALKGEYKNLLLTPEFSFAIELEKYLRNLVVNAIEAGISVPVTVSALSYYDSLRAERMSVNMVQALRDCFGAHTYERIDKEGSFHTIW